MILVVDNTYSVPDSIRRWSVGQMDASRRGASRAGLRRQTPDHLAFFQRGKAHRAHHDEGHDERGIRPVRGGRALDDLRRVAIGAARRALMLFDASFFGTFIGILTNQFGVAWSAHTGVAATLNSLMPIYLMPLSVLCLQEKFGRQEVLATLISIAGVALMMLGSG